MSTSILVINAGSSSIKGALYQAETDPPQRLLRAEVDGLGNRPALRLGGAPEAEQAAAELPADADHADALEALLQRLRELPEGQDLAAVGHRVVHGGTEFAAPVRVDDEILDRLGRYTPLAPLHQPHNLAAIRALADLHPELAQVACFDTAFHRSQPAVAQRFALPQAYEAEGVLRYGFHGLSYEYIAGVLPEHDPAAASGRAVVAHLGHGASMCALHGGQSVATSMGFTALDGLPMGTRCGSLDPGVVTYLQRRHGLTVEDVEELLYRRSGLYGVSGLSSDMRELLASDEPRAAAAVELFAYRVNRELGSLVAALGGLDALVFTAGIGEHAAAVRSRIMDQAAWTGLKADAAANRTHGPRISATDSAVRAWVIPTDEEQVIARSTRALMG